MPVESYDLFLSYTRRDNGDPPWVEWLLDSLRTEYAATGTDPLRVFFDQKSLRAGGDWERDLRSALRESFALVAVVSAGYFQSEWCRKEWDEFQRVRQSRPHAQNSVIPVFLEDPREIEKSLPPAAREWWADLGKNNAAVLLGPHKGAGRGAFSVPAVREGLAKFAKELRGVVELEARLARVPRKLRDRNPNFVGREAAFRELDKVLEGRQVVGLCAVNGVGGIGKTSVAREYAHRRRERYLGGQLEIDLAGARSFATIQAGLIAFARYDMRITDFPADNETEQYRWALTAFKSLPPGERVLLILDNLDEQAVDLLSSTQREQLPTRERMDVLVTTRAAAHELGGLQTVRLDVLSARDALDLLYALRPYERPAEEADWVAARDGQPLPFGGEREVTADWQAAWVIAERLGRHALAVTLAGAYLTTHPEFSYREFATQMGQAGIGVALDAAGRDADVKRMLDHPHTLIGELLRPTLERLKPVERRLLEYASLLPSEGIPEEWLRSLVETDAELADQVTHPEFSYRAFVTQMGQAGIGVALDAAGRCGGCTRSCGMWCGGNCARRGRSSGGWGGGWSTRRRERSRLASIHPGRCRWGRSRR